MLVVVFGMPRRVAHAEGRIGHDSDRDQGDRPAGQSSAPPPLKSKRIEKAEQRNQRYEMTGQDAPVHNQAKGKNEQDWQRDTANQEHDRPHPKPVSDLEQSSDPS